MSMSPRAKKPLETVSSALKAMNMKPQTKKQQHVLSCVGLESLVVSSPIGDLDIISCHRGLHLVKQADPDDKGFSPDESCPVEVKSTSDAPLPKPSEQCVLWLKDYFSHGIANKDIPALCQSIIDDSSFRGQAWKMLPSAVPFGERMTYLELAELCGNSKACRAAGSAMSSNPISFLIPCHRVVPSNGGIGNYSGGRKNSIKAWLLDFEHKHSNGR